MASRSHKPCAKSGCPNLTMTPKRFCTNHQNLEVETIKQSNRDYRTSRTDKVEQQFYKSKEWSKIRAYRMALDHGLCQPCFRDKIITKATKVHHIIEIKENWDLRLVIDNLESVCTSCHNKTHRKR